MKNPLIDNKIFLFITEFLVGVGLMGVEIGASRLIAPYLSSSQVIWTIIIGMIMIAMALGNFLGGKLSDKYKDPSYLYYFLLFSGTYIILIPFIGRFIILGITGLFALFVGESIIIWSSIFICLILFIPPLLLLGMVTPTLIKYSMHNDKISGKTVGILEALNTLGSILGTFIPTFISIPLIGTQATFVLFGMLIVIVALTFIVTSHITFYKNKKISNQEVIINEDSEDVEKIIKGEKVDDNESISLPKFKIRRMIFVITCLLFIISGSILSLNSSDFVFWDNSDIIYQDESMYNYLQVRENKEDDTYEFSTSVLFSVQSAVKKNGDLTGSYYDYCLAAPYMLNDLNEDDTYDILILGNGTGSYASLLKYDTEGNDYNHFPYKTNICGVEIDKKIIEIGEKYFCPKRLGVKTVCDDGRNYINHDNNKYDVIMVDAYSSISAPFQMTTIEFFKEVKKHLKNDGIMVLNINMATGKKNSVEYALCDTVTTQFDNVYKYKLMDTSGMEVFASNNSNMMANLNNNINNIERDKLKETLKSVYDLSTIHIDSGIRLYDDNSNVELRSMDALNVIIKDEIKEYKDYYKKHGLKALIKYLLS